MVAVAIAVFFVWRFWIKKKREQMDAEEWEEEDDIAQQKSVGGGDGERRFTSMHHQLGADAASIRTRGSVAQSFLSRASNIIQIAYIPGVTNRNNSNHNSLLGQAPVPPVPAARGSMPRSPLRNQNEALFFRPGDLRDSSYSDTGSLASNNRDTQYRQSITPSLARSSVASTIYRDDGSSEPMPATQVQRVAPRMVSVKSSQSNSPGESPESETPTASLHSGNGGNAGKGKSIQVMMPGQSASGPSPQSSIRSYGKPTQVTVGKGRIPVRVPSDATSTQSRHAPNVSSPLAEAGSSDDEDEPRRDVYAAAPASQPVESPFFDDTERPSGSRAHNPYAQLGASIGAEDRAGMKRGGKGMGGLSAVIEEATKRASTVPSHEGLGGRRDGSPFSDLHSTE